MKNVKETLTGPQFRTHRAKMGLRSNEIARLMGVRVETVWRWETGRVPVPESVEMAMVNLEQEPETVRDIKLNRNLVRQQNRQNRRLDRARQEQNQNFIGVDMAQRGPDRSATVGIDTETGTVTELEPESVKCDVTNIRVPDSIPEPKSDDSGLDSEAITAIKTPQSHDRAQSGSMPANKTQHMNAELTFKGKTIKAPISDSALRLSVPDGISKEETLQILKQLIASIEGLNLEAADPRGTTVVVQMMRTVGKECDG